MKYRIGIDLGGTNIKMGLIKGDKVINKIKKPTGSKADKKYILEILIQSINEIKKSINKKEIYSIGIGVPGTLNKKRDKVLHLPNIPNFKNIALKKILEDEFKIPVKMDNDTNAFALAESLYGAGKGKNNIICITIGTGLGGAIIINKKLYYGKCCAGELGHITINFKGKKCNCGNKGCLEEYVSSRAIARYSKQIMGKIYHPLEIENMAKKGNKKAKKVYEKLGEYLGIGLVNLNNIFNPDLIIIGGSISNAGNLIINKTKKILKERSMLVPAKIVKTKLKENAGIIGAAYLR